MRYFSKTERKCFFSFPVESETKRIDEWTTKRSFLLKLIKENQLHFFFLLENSVRTLLHEKMQCKHWFLKNRDIKLRSYRPAPAQIMVHLKSLSKKHSQFPLTVSPIVRESLSDLISGITMHRGPERSSNTERHSKLFHSQPGPTSSYLQTLFKVLLVCLSVLWSSIYLESELCRFSMSGPF